MKHWRTAHGLSQEALIDSAGIDQTYVSAIDAGETTLLTFAPLAQLQPEPRFQYFDKSMASRRLGRKKS